LLRELHFDFGIFQAEQFVQQFPVDGIHGEPSDQDVFELDLAVLDRWAIPSARMNTTLAFGMALSGNSNDSL
jgi:hypothetical protein